MLPDQAVPVLIDPVLTDANNKPDTLIIALTEAGEALARCLQQSLPGSEYWYKPQPFAQCVQQAFISGRPLVFICATGIVMRTLAPVLVSKREDPPVLVIDEQGRYVVSLLSGHEGGANEWAAAIARLTKGEAVITSSRSYLNPVYTVGMGCERHCPEAHLQSLLFECLDQVKLGVEHISGIASIDIKADECGLISLCKTLNKPFVTFSPDELSTVDHQLSVRSEYVFRTVGVYGVAESAALVAAAQTTGQVAELLLCKQKTARATCAIARSYTDEVGT